MTKCLVWFCRNKRSINRNVKYFRITKTRCNSWLAAIGRTPNQETLSDNNVICSEHFLDSDFLDSKRTKLSKNAVPSARLRASCVLQSSVPAGAKNGSVYLPLPSKPSLPTAISTTNSCTTADTTKDSTKKTEEANEVNCIENGQEVEGATCNTPSGDIDSEDEEETATQSKHHKSTFHNYSMSPKGLFRKLEMEKSKNVYLATQVRIMRKRMKKMSEKICDLESIIIDLRRSRRQLLKITH